jgi:hypothetical protein
LGEITDKGCGNNAVDVDERKFLPPALMVDVDENKGEKSEDEEEEEEGTGVDDGNENNND